MVPIVRNLLNKEMTIEESFISLVSIKDMSEEMKDNALQTYLLTLHELHYSLTGEIKWFCLVLLTTKDGNRLSTRRLSQALKFMSKFPSLVSVLDKFINQLLNYIDPEDHVLVVHAVADCIHCDYHLSDVAKTLIKRCGIDEKLLKWLNISVIEDSDKVLEALAKNTYLIKEKVPQVLSNLDKFHTVKFFREKVIPSQGELVRELLRVYTSIPSPKSLIVLIQVLCRHRPELVPYLEPLEEKDWDRLYSDCESIEPFVVAPVNDKVVKKFVKLIKTLGAVDSYVMRHIPAEIVKRVVRDIPDSIVSGLMSGTRAAEEFDIATRVRILKACLRSKRTIIRVFPDKSTDRGLIDPLTDRDIISFVDKIPQNYGMPVFIHLHPDDIKKLHDRAVLISIASPSENIIHVIRTLHEKISNQDTLQ